MAGGKETPRQKMIGMMYLVLTALLALNVSKEVIAAFVRINDKIDSSSQIIHENSDNIYHLFDQKKAGILTLNGDLTEFNLWYDKAKKLKFKSENLIGYILSECNEMITLAEGVDWVEKKNERGIITQLKPLIKIENMDNYDIPTQIFVGSNPKKPIERGLEFRKSIHQFRDSICVILADFSNKEEQHFFDPKKASENLTEALANVSKEDRSKIEHFYNSLSIPESLTPINEDEGKMPWSSVMFDHAPIVAVASMLNSLKLDVKNAESFAAEFILSKIEAPIFDFNKIEPMTFANSNYLNVGDSLNLSVMIAAYDSNKTTTIRYGIDKDTMLNNWKETTGGIVLSSSEPGNHIVKGAIGVDEKGIQTWKPWTFNYTVGKPTGIIAMPFRNVLYKGYENIIEATASGYPAESISVSGTGCSLSKKGSQWEVIPHPNVRKASISVYGRKTDGSSIKLGTYQYDIKRLPKPNVFLGSIKDGDNPSISAVTSSTRVILLMDQSVNLTNIKYTVVSGIITADGIKGIGHVLSGGRLDPAAKRILKQSKGKKVSMSIKYHDTSKIISKANSFSIKVK